MAPNEWTSEKITAWLSDKNTQDNMYHTVLPVVTFWGTMNIIQRVSGAVGYHSGKRGSLLIESYRISGTKETGSWWGWFQGGVARGKKRPSDEPWSSEGAKGLVVVRTGFTLAIYSALSGNWCQTALPSSIITIGSYAKAPLFSSFLNCCTTVLGQNLPYSLSGAVPSSSPVATLNERIAVNKKGRLLGCHHCGSRQLLTTERFIADHMPPTKIANEMNESFWRKWFNIKVKQALWPQCQPCFQMQGSAVRVNEHRLVYVSGLRIHHFALLLALLASDRLVESVEYAALEAWIEDLIRRLKRLF